MQIATGYEENDVRLIFPYKMIKGNGSNASMNRMANNVANAIDAYKKNLSNIFVRTWKSNTTLRTEKTKSVNLKYKNDSHKMRMLITWPTIDKSKEYNSSKPKENNRQYKPSEKLEQYLVERGNKTHVVEIWRNDNEDIYTHPFKFTKITVNSQDKEIDKECYLNFRKVLINIFGNTDFVDGVGIWKRTKSSTHKNNKIIKGTGANLYNLLSTRADITKLFHITKVRENPNQNKEIIITAKNSKNKSENFKFSKNTEWVLYRQHGWKNQTMATATSNWSRTRTPLTNWQTLPDTKGTKRNQPNGSIRN